VRGAATAREVGHAMGLLTRIRTRLRGSAGSPAVLGARFTPALEEVWRELEEQVDGELKKAGSSIVGSWEVGAAELGRAVVGLPDDKVFVERFSDALVPTLQPFQDLHKGIAGAMQTGLRAGLATGTMAAATAPLARLMDGLDEQAAVGWAKTTTHLGPIFAACARPDEARDRFLAGDRALRQACVDADAVWRARLAALPEAPGLWEGLTGAAEAWQLSVTRGLEIGIDRQTKGLVAALRAAR
jgi:hypothetical protein